MFASVRLSAYFTIVYMEDTTHTVESLRRVSFHFALISHLCQGLRLALTYIRVVHPKVGR